MGYIDRQMNVGGTPSLAGYNITKDNTIQTGIGSNWLDSLVNSADGGLASLSGLVSGTGSYLGKQSLGDLTDLGSLAFGAYDQLFGNKADLFKEQLGLLRDKRAANNEALANTRLVNKNLAEGFNKGLAGSNYKVV